MSAIWCLPKYGYLSVHIAYYSFLSYLFLDKICICFCFFLNVMKSLIILCTIFHYTGEGYSAVCEAFRNSRSQRLDINSNLANVTFTDMTGATFKFVNREGNKGYILYKAEMTTTGTSQNYNYLRVSQICVLEQSCAHPIMTMFFCVKQHIHIYTFLLMSSS